jgi:hypothetical protein
MRSLTLRRAAVAAVVPLTLGALAGCGSSHSSTAADAHAPSGSPSSRTPSGTTGSGATGHSVDPAAFVTRLKTSAQSLTTARFSMNMDLSGQTIQSKGALDMTGDHPAMDVTMDLSGMGTPTNMRLVGGDMYIQDPTSGSGKYLEMSLEDPNGPLAGMGDALDTYNPSQIIGSLSPDTFRKVTDLGSESVGGRQLEHYRVVLDTGAISKALKNLPSSASLPKTATYDMWLDSQDRMAKFTMVMKKVSRVTATYTDYGADVNITAPPPSQVMQMPSGASG